MINRRKFLGFTAALLPCAFAAKLLGENKIENSYWHCSVETRSLTNFSDEELVAECDRLNRGLEQMILACKKQGREICDIKFLWRNIVTANGPDKFFRVIMRSVNPNYPVVMRTLSLKDLK